MLKEKYVEVNLSQNKMVSYYANKGYICNLHDRIMVKVDDLQPSSAAIVTKICDYCGKEVKTHYHVYRRHRNNSVVNKDACNACGRLKISDVCEIKYGNKYPVQLDFVKEKMKKTSIERYGVDHPRKNKEIDDKIKNTMIERYGAAGPTHDKSVREKIKKSLMDKYGYDHPSRVPEIAERRKNTFIEKYGVDNPFKAIDFKEKSIRTCREKYGTDWAMQSKIVQAKVRDSMFSNGTAPISEGQRKLRDIIGGILNYPIGHCSVDILWFDGIIVEYDGSGHDMRVTMHQMTTEEFEKKEHEREFFLVYDCGLKIIRIINPKDKDIFYDDYIAPIFKQCVERINEGYDVVKYDVKTESFQYYKLLL